MEIKTLSANRRRAILVDWIGLIGFILFILATTAIILFDDIQMAKTTAEELATIYNRRFFGIKIIDSISLILILIVFLDILLRQEIIITIFHKMIGIIFLVYCYAAIIGFIYSFFLKYDYAIWLQDFQPTIYMVGYFIITFVLIDSIKKWKYYVIAFLSLMALKNIIIFYRTFSGLGNLIGDWAFRASQNSEFTYFPMMFFPLLLLLLKRKSLPIRICFTIILSIYLFNALLGIVRTVWVMLIIGNLFLLYQLDWKTRYRLMVVGLLSIIVVLSGINLLFPRFLKLAWNYKFASIFEWSVQSDRSNATRTIEIMNVTNYVFRNFAFIQGMGLGSWWDDSARKLLPDFGSGYMFKTKFHTTHMWYITQLLKIGIVGLLFYWYAVYKIFIIGYDFIKTMTWQSWEKCILLGLNIGLLCAFVSSADFVRMFLVIGINIGIIARYIYEENSQLKY